MAAPEVLSVIETVCADVYVPVAGVITGVAAGDVVVPPSLKTQLTICCVAVREPVPPVNPTYAVFPPTVAGMLIVHDVVNVSAGIFWSVTVIDKVVPL